jgi:hypothetical protein
MKRDRTADIETAAAGALPSSGGTYERRRTGALVLVDAPTRPQAGKSERARLAAAAAERLDAPAPAPAPAPIDDAGEAAVAEPAPLTSEE